MKHALEHEPVLGLPEFDAIIVFEIDSSDLTVGIVLMQYDWPVAFISKALKSAQCNYYTIDHKLLAIVLV